MTTLLRRILFALIGLIVLLVAAFLIAVSLSINVDLSTIRPAGAALASNALGREVRIEGEMILVPTFSPTFEMHGLTIANPPGWATPEFAHMDLAYIEIAILPLLRGRVVVREIRAEGVEVVFEQDERGEVNWRFSAPETDRELADEAVEEDDTIETWDAEDLYVTSIEIVDLSMRNIAVKLVRPAEKPIVFVIDELSGHAATETTLQLEARGRYRGHPYTFGIDGGSVVSLLMGNEDWPINISLEIAETKLRIQGLIDRGEWRIDELIGVLLAPDPTRAPDRIAELEISLEGERLDSLDTLIGLSLPPLGPHAMQGRFSAHMNGRFDSEIEVQVGESRLVGTLEVELGATPPRARLSLVSDTIQLQDFDVGNWTLVGSGETEATDPSDPFAPLAPRALLDPEVMRRFEFELKLRVKEARSGRDRLGTLKLDAKLQNGSFVLGPLHLEVPGGSLDLEAAITPGERDVRTSFRAEVDHFDYGILARRVKPESEMAGIFGLDVEIESRSPSLETLIEHASGHIDFAIFPEEFEAGIFDLWAVSLMSSVLPKLDSAENSKINCIVGLFNLADGRLWQESILIDSSKMSAVGTAEVDFRTQRVEIELVPKAKEPEFFALATPIQVSGTISDFDVGVKTEDLIGTVIQFTTSIVHVPIRRIFGATVPADGVEICLAATKRRPPGEKAPRKFKLWK